jgi:hypothetical protein
VFRLLDAGQVDVFIRFTGYILATFLILAVSLTHRIPADITKRSGRRQWHCFLTINNREHIRIVIVVYCHVRPLLLPHTTTGHVVSATCATALAQKSDLLIGSFEFLLQLGNLLLLILYHNLPWIQIHMGHIRNATSPRSILQRRHIFVLVNVDGRQARHHEAVGVSAQTLPKHRGQLGLAIRNVIHLATSAPVLILLSILRECLNDLPQREERLVDFDRFFEQGGIRGTLYTRCVALSLAASQVHELQLAYDLLFGALHVLLVHGEGKDAVAARARIVHLVRAHHFVLQALPEVSQRFRLICALENKHVLYVRLLSDRV